MASPLVPCPACSRHIRLPQAREEASREGAQCPFCSAPLPADLGAQVVPPARTRLTRLAAFTFAATAATATALAGCGGNIEGSTDHTKQDLGRGIHEEDGGAPHAMYGLPYPGDQDAGPCNVCGDDGGMQAMYGLPYPGEDSGSAHAMYGIPYPDHDGGMAPLYGLPPD